MNTFEDYLRSIGGEQFTQYSDRPAGPALTQGQRTAQFPNIGIGNQVTAANISMPVEQANIYKRQQGYRDSDNAFLGYGSDPNSLYNNNSDIQRQYQEYVARSPERESQRLANERAAEEARILQAQRLGQQREQALPTLANFNPMPQQFSGGLMGQQPQPQQQQPMQQPMQQQGGLINYTHRGGMGGMGGAGGLHRGGLIAPSGSNGGGQ